MSIPAKTAPARERRVSSWAATNGMAASTVASAARVKRFGIRPVRSSTTAATTTSAATRIAGATTG